MKGTIKFFDEKKNFGFITGEDEKDYFFHKSYLPKNITNIEKNEAVTFDADKTERGLQAKHITFRV